MKCKVQATSLKCSCTDWNITFCQLTKAYRVFLTSQCFLDSLILHSSISPGRERVQRPEEESGGGDQRAEGQDAV